MNYARLVALVLSLAVSATIAYKLGASHWKGLYDGLVAENWKDTALAEMTARKSVEKQLADVREQLHTNEAKLDDLHEKQAAVVADRDRTRALADRLLHRPQACPNRSGVPEANRQSGTPETRQATGDDRLRELLVAAREECVGNADTLDTLIGQIQPQL